MKTILSGTKKCLSKVIPLMLWFGLSIKFSTDESTAQTFQAFDI